MDYLKIMLTGGEQISFWFAAFKILTLLDFHKLATAGYRLAVIKHWHVTELEHIVLAVSSSLHLLIRTTANYFLRYVYQ